MNKPASVPTSLPERAADTTAKRPWPVHFLARKIASYVDRMSEVWVEGQALKIARRQRTSWLTLRDVQEESSLSVAIPTRLLDALDAPLTQGARISVRVKARFWTKNGSLTMWASAVEAVGEGQLLARLAALRKVLAAEGLFATERKTPVPFLPQKVGLICGRDSDAEHDVVRNARRRWPATQFTIRNVPVQGVGTVQKVTAALAELDALPEVEVIVITRGGGSLEDLLPFSDEQLVRAVAAARTPVVSAIGHEQDRPLLDDVADLRASTPTAAAELVVPHLRQEQELIRQSQAQMRHQLATMLSTHRHELTALRSRPALARPQELLQMRHREISAEITTARYAVSQRLARHREALAGLRAQVRTLSPQATLERGYAVVQTASGVVSTAASIPVNTPITVTLADGRFPALARPQNAPLDNTTN